MSWQWFAPLCSRHAVHMVWSEYGLVGWKCPICSKELLNVITTDRSDV